MVPFSETSRLFYIRALMVLVVLGFVGWEFVQWTVNHVYVPPGKSLRVRYKGPLLFGRRNMAPAGRLATDEGNQIGVRERMLGPGRHFYCPLWWELKLVDDVVVEPGKVLLVRSNFGDDMSTAPGADAQDGSGNVLVEGELGSTTQKGVLRRLYASGRYRINDFAYEVRPFDLLREQKGTQVKYAGWVNIRPGTVGVVTNQVASVGRGPDGKPLSNKGVQAEVLQPGIYLVNPQEKKVDIVQIGFLEKSISTQMQHDAQGNELLDASGEPIMAKSAGGISFPSKDGFTIHMDFTAIWGILPEQAPRIVQNSGNIEAVENRIVVPLIESICRNQGSKLGAVELLVGNSREKFQEDTAKQFEKDLAEMGVSLQYALVRHIYIPQEVRLPIQQANLADELTLTRDQEQLTARTEANLREAEQKVELEAGRTRVETEKLTAQLRAEGEKKAAETKAETVKLIAEIDKKTAELEAQATVVRGKADADALTLQEEARANKFKLAVSAFGSGDAFNLWVFATGLPEDIKLQLLYAGDGTLWTDLKGMTDTLLMRQTQSQPGPRPAGK